MLRLSHCGGDSLVIASSSGEFCLSDHCKFGGVLSVKCNTPHATFLLIRQGVMAMSCKSGIILR